jgi:Flp pilus assembly pilin Flp
VRRVGAEEKRMLGVLTQLAREEEAQDLIEYSLLCALLAVACITGILQLTQILGFFAMVGAILRAAI